MSLIVHLYTFRGRCLEMWIWTLGYELWQNEHFHLLQLINLQNKTQKQKQTSKYPKTKRYKKQKQKNKQISKRKKKQKQNKSKKKINTITENKIFDFVILGITLYTINFILVIFWQSFISHHLCESFWSMGPSTNC